MKIEVKTAPSVWMLGDDNVFWCQHADYDVELVERELSINHSSGELVSDLVQAAICSDCGEDISEEVL